MLKSKMVRKLVSALLITTATTNMTPITIGHYTASYGEIEVAGKLAEINAISTGQGFVVKNHHYKECKDYILIIDNKNTKNMNDDKLIKVIEIK